MVKLETLYIHTTKFVLFGFELVLKIILNSLNNL